MKAALFACTSLLWLLATAAALPAKQQYAWTLPAGFPPPMVPADNRDDAAVAADVRRGEMLFHSRPLSCFTCHGGNHFSRFANPWPQP